MISGFGGSIHYGDGLKLSKFPSGRRLQKILGADAESHMNESLSLFLDGEPDSSFCRPRAQFDHIELKAYPVMVLSSEQVSRLVERLHERVARYSNIELHLGTRIERIEPTSSGFEVIGRKRTRGAIERYRAQRVIVAVGRKGQRWWHNEVRRLDLGFVPPTPSVGVRFECPPEFLRNASEAHPDFKATIYEEEVKVKTFCFCAGKGGGRIKFTDYGLYTLLDGHVVPELGAGPSNFALLAQLMDESGSPQPLEWIDSNLIEPYRALRKDRPGKPVMQWYPDFREKRVTCGTFADLVSVAGFTPSVTDYAMANLAAVLPPRIHNSICRVFERLLGGFTGQTVSPGSLPDWYQRVAVMGLELEGLWDEIRVSQSMESTLDGLYVCGDCSGHAQGILQAAAGGIAAAAACAGTPAMQGAVSDNVQL